MIDKIQHLAIPPVFRLHLVDSLFVTFFSYTQIKWLPFIYDTYWTFISFLFLFRLYGIYAKKTHKQIEVELSDIMVVACDKWLFVFCVCFDKDIVCLRALPCLIRWQFRVYFVESKQSNQNESQPWNNKKSTCTPTKAKTNLCR